MLFSGISELLADEEGSKIILDLGYPLYINYILGIAKTLGAIAIIQTKFRTIKNGFMQDLHLIS